MAGGGAVLITHPVQALALQARLPGLTVPVLQSGYMAVGRVIAVAPAALATGLGQAAFDSSTEAAIHMSDHALAIVSSGPATVTDPDQVALADQQRRRQVAFSISPGR